MKEKIMNISFEIVKRITSYCPLGRRSYTDCNIEFIEDCRDKCEFFFERNGKYTCEWYEYEPIIFSNPPPKVYPPVVYYYEIKCANCGTRISFWKNFNSGLSIGDTYKCKKCGLNHVFLKSTGDIDGTSKEIFAIPKKEWIAKNKKD